MLDRRSIQARQSESGNLPLECFDAPLLILDDLGQDRDNLHRIDLLPRAIPDRAGQTVALKTHAPVVSRDRLDVHDGSEPAYRLDRFGCGQRPDVARTAHDSNENVIGSDRPGRDSGSRECHTAGGVLTIDRPAAWKLAPQCSHGAGAVGPVEYDTQVLRTSRK